MHAEGKRVCCAYRHYMDIGQLPRHGLDMYTRSEANEIEVECFFQIRKI